ncbi:hypothetical protein GKZ68_21585 (plasmid) [Hymenobacter sp. BRD128]|uniref:hypothetical protein n=1 Tax=Hymenobacter sp. BRD128 TaxID=2675878 RepID=UPI00156766F5|nr:hypothetical protein [Hymenobacter sp. BRD128]QKG59274.1 hypothetical protein GKZ68_21585 [Hymenobacter sp. BRD128]
MEPLHYTACARTLSAPWQSLLRQSVRLYLLWREPSRVSTSTEAALRLVESQLVQHLVQGRPASQVALDEANALLEAAQAELLGSEQEVAALLDNDAQLDNSRQLVPPASRARRQLKIAC